MNNRLLLALYTAPQLEIRSWLPAQDMGGDYDFLKPQKPAREIREKAPKPTESLLNKLEREFEKQARQEEYEQRILATGYKGRVSSLPRGRITYNRISSSDIARDEERGLEIGIFHQPKIRK